jgi:hypothetical protein
MLTETIRFLALVVTALAQQTSSPENGALLARIPAGVTVTSPLVAEPNLACFTYRSSLTWSADGRTVAYVARRGDEYFPVVGSELGEAYGDVQMPVLAGGHAFFVVSRAVTESTGHWWLWIDGKTVRQEDWMGDLAVRDDGRQVAYWSQPGAKLGNAEQATSSDHYLVLGTERSGHWSFERGERWFDCTTTKALYGSGRERVFTWAADNGWFVIQSGKPEKRLTEAQPGIDGIAISADGSALAYVKRSGASSGTAPCAAAGEGRELYFKGKRVGRKFDVVSRPAVDARGAHVAYVVGLDGRSTVAIDDDEHPQGRYDHVIELAFDPQGTRLAFVANEGGHPHTTAAAAIEGGQSFVVVVSVAEHGKAVEQARFLKVRELVWSPSGERLAYCTRDEVGWRIVCDEMRSESCDEVGTPHFAPEGASLHFGARTGRDLWWRELRLP